MKLGEVATNICSGQIISRVEAKEGVSDSILEECKVVVPKSISFGRLNHADLGVVKLKKEVDESRITKVGDIVLKLSTPYDAAYIEEGDEGFVVPSFCAIIRGIDIKLANTKFVVAYINTDYVREQLKAKVAGTTMPMIKLKDIKEIEIPPVPNETQSILGAAYSLSCQKQDVLRELLANEQTLISNIILKAIKEAQSNEKQ